MQLYKIFESNYSDISGFLSQKAVFSHFRTKTDQLLAFKLFVLATETLQMQIQIDFTHCQNSRSSLFNRYTVWNEYMHSNISQSMSKSINILAKQNKIGRKCYHHTSRTLRLKRHKLYYLQVTNLGTQKRSLCLWS